MNVHSSRAPKRQSPFYESWFLRGNHSEKQEAFWIRYTLFRQPGKDTVGELWAILFRDGEVFADKALIPAKDVGIGQSTSAGLDLQLGTAMLLPGKASGAAGHFEWDLRFSEEAPLLLLPERLYAAPFPKAKALVGSPGARFEGEIRFRGEAICIDGFIGSQNHNWGSEHTSEYAWGQIAGFDEAPGAFLELSTARIKLGPVRTPWMTPIVFREGGEELRLSGLLQAVRNHGHSDPMTLRWGFGASPSGGSIEGEIFAPPEAFVAIPYENPPGGTKHCLNSKIARAQVQIDWRGQVRSLHSSGAAFEILGDAAMRRYPGIRFIDLPSPRS